MPDGTLNAAAQTSPKQRTILIADDEPQTLDTLDEFFSGLGHRTVCAKDGAEVLAKASCSPDIVLLDVEMPQVDGYEACRRLREHLDCPIVFLTTQTDEASKIAVFETGGDDYVTKPFSLAVLGARVQAHLAREERRANRAQVCFDGDIVIDYRARTIHVAGQPLGLTAREFDLVAFLSRHPGQVFDRDHIHEAVWGWDSKSAATVVTEFVRRVRNKLSKAGCTYDVVETVWGMGYRWRI